jgi:hypothetical protein
MVACPRCPEPWWGLALALAVHASAAQAADAADVASSEQAGWKPRVGGFIQADSILTKQSSQDEVNAATGAPLNQTRFFVRRARVRLDVEHHFVWGGVELDANTIDGVRAGLTEADVGVGWKGPALGEPSSARATLGLFRIPFGREVPERDVDRFFLERTTLSRALFPGSVDAGGRLDGGFGPLRFAVALMNGNPVGDASFPARDPNAAKDLVARLGVDAELSSKVRLRGGFSVVDGAGFHQGTPSTKDVIVWRDANENGLVESTEIQVLSGSAATASQSFDRFALGSDLCLTAELPWLGVLTLSGELVWAENLDRAVRPADPVSLGRDVREMGFYVGVTQEVTRYAMVGVRYDHYDPDQDGAEQRGLALVPRDASYSTLAFAAALRYAPGRLILEYDRNDNALGRTPAGIPTTLADDQLALRGEVVF